MKDPSDNSFQMTFAFQAGTLAGAVDGLIPGSDQPPVKNAYPSAYAQMRGLRANTRAGQKNRNRNDL